MGSYVGIDLHRRRSVVVVLNAAGDRVSWSRIDNSPAELARELETSVRNEPLTRGMTFAAVRIALELGVGARELPRRQELGAGRPRHERASDRRHDHQRTEEHRGFDARAHSEKIQR